MIGDGGAKRRSLRSARGTEISIPFSAKRSVYSDNAELFDPIRNLLHRGPARVYRGLSKLLDQSDRELIRQFPSVVGHCY
jgi:hypothetical protein